MSYIDNSENQTRFTFNKLDYNIPNKHISHFIKKFVSKNFSYLDKKYEKKRGRPAFPKTSLLNLIIYGKYDNFKTMKEISDSCDITYITDIYQADSYHQTGHFKDL